MQVTNSQRNQSSGHKRVVVLTALAYMAYTVLRQYAVDEMADVLMYGCTTLSTYTTLGGLALKICAIHQCPMARIQVLCILQACHLLHLTARATASKKPKTLEELKEHHQSLSIQLLLFLLDHIPPACSPFECVFQVI